MNIAQQTIHLENHAAEHFVLTNTNGMQVELMNWGATLLDVRVPDKNGVIESVTLAYADLSDYVRNASFLGCVVGRVAGRIAHSKFQLNGRQHHVPPNSGAHHLHGGAEGMWQRPWTVAHVSESSVSFAYISADGENGYPATLRIRVTYTLDDDNALTIDYRANADAPTLCNLTNHAYFNLSGNARRDVQSHVLQVNASKICAMNDELLVTGDEWLVANTPFDFRQATTIGATLGSSDARIKLAKGIDHYFILDSNYAEEPQVTLHDEASGRRLRVWTDQPCVVLYAHNYSNGEQLRHGVTGQPFDALCIEMQKTPHMPFENGDHPAAISAQDDYAQTTLFRFDVL